MKGSLRLLAVVLLAALSLVGQGSGVIAPADNLVAEGIPPILAALAERLRQEKEPGLPVLFHRALRPGVPAEVTALLAS